VGAAAHNPLITADLISRQAAIGHPADCIGEAFGID
jgi:hypothetical protein